MDDAGSSGSAEFEDFDDDEIWRAEEATADAEQRWAEEALAEVAAAEELEMGDLEDEDHWMSEANIHEEEWMEPDFGEFVESLDNFEDALESLEHDPYDMGDSDDDISLADFEVTQPDPIPDFNDWGSDPGGADKAAALSMTLTWQKSWEVPKTPLGSAELWQFGPNGPPMNVMDTCSVSQTLWIANQQNLFGFELSALEAYANDPNLGSELPCSQLTSSRGQVNRLRCGRLGHQSVVVAVDAAGGVLVAPSQLNSKLPPIRLLNVPPGREQGISTWGIGLPRPEEGADAGPLLVSANDHWLKAWWLSPDAGDHRRDRSSWQLQNVKGRAPSDKSPFPVWHFGENLPSIDVMQKQALVASLGGEVSVLNLASPAQMNEDVAVPDMPAVHIIEEHPQLDDQLCCKFPPRWPLHEDQKTVRCFGHAESRRVWNVCWIPLRSIQTVSGQPPIGGGSVNDSTLEWSTEPSGSALPAEIIRNVLSLMGPQELLQHVQCLNRQHAYLAQEQVLSSKRTEQMALIFSENTVWLTDGCLNMRCKQTLPFNGAFAHVVYMSGLSAAIVSTKMGSPNCPLWAVTVLRRERSLRFELRVRNLAVETDFSELAWSRNIVVGMAAAQNRLLILYSSCRLVCYDMALERQQVQAVEEAAEEAE